MGPIDTRCIWSWLLQIYSLF